ncbi:MAG: PcfJ domain-containing protein [Clostridia bacterium]|nr:PcfJ domain-containing protein [Clostridia bacterium]
MNDTVKDEFAGMPEIPQYIYDKIDEGFRKYLFFETIKKGHRRYTCTACHKTFEEGELVLRDVMSAEDFALFRAKHNDYAECPLCGARAMVKNVKVSDVSGFWESNCVAVFMANSHDDVWIRAIYADRGYCYKNATGEIVNYLHGKTKHWESARYHLTPGHYDHWKAWSSDRPLVYETHATEPFTWNHGLYAEKYDYHIAYVQDLKDTFLCYHGMSNFYMANHPIRYLCHYAEHPQLEMLSRMKHDFLVYEVVMENRDNTSLLDWSAKKPWDLYRLPKQEYNEWAKYRYDLDVYKIFKRIKGKGRRDWERAKELDDNFYRLKGVYAFIAKARRLKVEVRELMNYINRVQQNSGGGCWHCPGITLQEAYTLWGDYIALAEKAGMVGTVSPMPKDLKVEHDRLLNVLKAIEERKQRRKWAEARKARMTAAQKEGKALERKYGGVRAFYKTVQKYAYKGKKYAVVVPTCIGDILYEAKDLNHCIARAPERYFDRIRSGESFLLFVRKAKKPNVPYYTIEVEPGGAVRQKRTYNDTQDHNIGEITAFLAEWQAAIQDKLTEKDKQAAAASREKRIEGLAELRQNKTVVRNGHLQGKLLADVLEADLLEVGFAPETKKKAERAKRKVG